jgi:hypothetical protein
MILPATRDSQLFHFDAASHLGDLGTIPFLVSPPRDGAKHRCAHRRRSAETGADGKVAGDVEVKGCRVQSPKGGLHERAVRRSGG